MRGEIELFERTPVSLIIRTACLAELVLIGCTWPLWFAAAVFPRVPLVALLKDAPTWVLAGVSCLFVICLLALIFCVGPCRRYQRALLTGAVLSGTMAVICNQQCLQPWHWLFLLALLMRLLLPLGDIRKVLCVVIASTYLFSAASRIGPYVSDGMGHRITLSLLHIVGVNASDDVVSLLCVLLTGLEFAVGVLLIVPRTRIVGLIGAIVMHLVLAVALSPAGMNQYPAVIVWNVFLAGWVPLIFLPCALSDAECLLPVGPAAWAAMIASFIWPLLALTGFTDSWTGWQLYSPRPAVLALRIHEDVVDWLPPDVGKHVAPPPLLDDWCPLRIDRWSLETTGAPLYPEARFQLAVAVHVTKFFSADAKIRANLNAPVIPAWWRRTRTEFPNGEAIRRAASGFFFNANPCDR